ncbi:DUF1462 family protein [Listeria sp. PSOL-1]|uniref:DUF1462 family protein n=1 Tax=Listeria sp. PSOL-1 TaxID=1844999 RepID=UPI0013D3DF02|nr:DUF1462 family protein [Listeria sp. PSOL-1]
MKKTVQLYVYGSSVACASCVGAPSSKAIKEWLSAAIERKFEQQPFLIKYLDVFETKGMTEEERQMAQRIMAEDYLYPVIVLDNKIVIEGEPRLQDIYKLMIEYGYEPTM